jgi:hypothetical protein
MFGERRKHRRYTINPAAKVLVESRGFSRDCLIVDISDGGARLFVETDDFPDDFQLLISGERVIREECHVAWRVGGEIGVTFCTKEREQERLQAMKDFQSQLQGTFTRRN